MDDLFRTARHEPALGMSLTISATAHVGAIVSALLLSHWVLANDPEPYLSASPQVLYLPVQRARPVVAGSKKPAPHKAIATSVPTMDENPPAPGIKVETGLFDHLRDTPPRVRGIINPLVGAMDTDSNRMGQFAPTGSVGLTGTFDAPLTSAALSRRTTRDVADEPAELLNIPVPTYTDDARQRRVTGKVVLKVKLCVNGEVQVLDIVSRLDDGLDQAAVAAVSKLRCRPARKDGLHVDVITEIKVTFTLT